MITEPSICGGGVIEVGDTFGAVRELEIRYVLGQTIGPGPVLSQIYIPAETVRIIDPALSIAAWQWCVNNPAETTGYMVQNQIRRII
jgi:hypothetical protein